MATCRPTFNVKTLTVGFRPLPQTTRTSRPARLRRRRPLGSSLNRVLPFRPLGGGMMSAAGNSLEGIEAVARTGVAVGASDGRSQGGTIGATVAVGGRAASVGGGRESVPGLVDGRSELARRPVSTRCDPQRRARARHPRDRGKGFLLGGGECLRRCGRRRQPTLTSTPARMANPRGQVITRLLVTNQTGPSPHVRGALPETSLLQVAARKFSSHWAFVRVPVGGNLGRSSRRGAASRG